MEQQQQHASVDRPREITLSWDRHLRLPTLLSLWGAVLAAFLSAPLWAAVGLFVVTLAVHDLESHLRP